LLLGQTLNKLFQLLNSKTCPMHNLFTLQICKLSNIPNNLVTKILPQAQTHRPIFSQNCRSHLLLTSIWDSHLLLPFLLFLTQQHQHLSLLAKVMLKRQNNLHNILLIPPSEVNISRSLTTIKGSIIHNHTLPYKIKINFIPNNKTNNFNNKTKIIQ
jgi:hypothetical protein